MASVQELSSVRLIPVQLPWGERADFKGVLDLLTLKAYAKDGKTAEAIPAEFADDVETARMALVEAGAEGEDELLEKYLEGGELSNEEVQRGLKNVISAGSYFPVFVAAGSAETGLARLLDGIVELLPSPSQSEPATAQGKDGEETLRPADNNPLAAYIWKTTADPYVGKINYFRVYSGMIASDSRVGYSVVQVPEMWEFAAEAQLLRILETSGARAYDEQLFRRLAAVHPNVDAFLNAGMATGGAVVAFDGRFHAHFWGATQSLPCGRAHRTSDSVHLLREADQPAP